MMTEPAREKEGCNAEAGCRGARSRMTPEQQQDFEEGLAHDLAHDEREEEEGGGR